MPALLQARQVHRRHLLSLRVSPIRKGACMFGRLMVERMLRAFCASALGFLAVGINGATLSSDGLRALGVGAFGAGVSACFTLISQFFGDPNSTSFTKTTVEPMEAGGK